MLKEAMLAMRVTDMEYAPEICGLLKAAYEDLRIAGVIIDGVCNFTTTVDTQTGITVTDNSTIRNELVKTAMITYAKIHFGEPTNREALEKSYDLQRKQLANATGYTDFTGTEGAEVP